MSGEGERTVAATVVVDGTVVTIEGAGPALVFVHGWPDTARLWDGQVAALRDRWRSVRFTLPGFDQAPRTRAREAYGFDEVVARIRRVIECACPGERVTLVLHDWGSVFGWWLAARHPELVARLVFVDVGDAGSRRHLRELGVLAKLATAAYQLWLATAWWIGGRIGDAMSRAFARAIRAPAPAGDVHAGMAFPYAVVWFGVRGGAPKPRPALPAVPLLFIHGERKPFALHSAAWAREVAARPGNAVMGLDAGHWLMVTQRDGFNAALIGWLERTTGATAP